MIKKKGGCRDSTVGPALATHAWEPGSDSSTREQVRDNVHIFIQALGDGGRDGALRLAAQSAWPGGWAWVQWLCLKPQSGQFLRHNSTGTTMLSFSCVGLESWT